MIEMDKRQTELQVVVIAIYLCACVCVSSCYGSRGQPDVSSASQTFTARPQETSLNVHCSATSNSIEEFSRPSESAGTFEPDLENNFSRSYLYDLLIVHVI